MALYIIKEKFRIYKGEKSAEPKFRRELSKLLIDKFGRGPFSQEEITEAIRFCLDYFIDKFTSICKSQTEFYFYQWVMKFHEDATELAVLHQSKSDEDAVSEEYLSIYRRILKFILETGCEVQMKTVVPVQADRFRVEKVLDDLIYLGDMILMCVSIYAEQGMIEDVSELTFKNDLFVFSRRHHYNFIFDHILNTWGHNVEKVVIDTNGMEDLFSATNRCLNIKYHDAGHVIAAIHEQQDFTEGVLWEGLPENLARIFSLPYKDCELFYKGLTLSKHNKMSLLDLACKPNNLKRYLYRPIIIWNVNGKDFAIMAPNAWAEAIIQFFTNAIPWGKGPEEWMQKECFKKYVHQKEDQHDKWLDDAVEEILKKNNCFYGRNVINLRGPGGYVNIDVPGLGEIDFIIISHDTKKIFITDCKHLISRYDAANQKNDYNAFTKGSQKNKSYNETMEKKVQWFKSQITLLEYHFAQKHKLDKLNLNDYEVEGIFIINTPTLYMYNSDFRIYVLNDISAVLSGSYTDAEFLIHINDKDHSKIMRISYPYLRKPDPLTIDPFEDES